MEQSPLNKAHQQQRKAEALLKHKKYEESIECHKQAIELLKEACNLTDNTKSLESLSLQKVYHQKQIDVVKMKNHQHQIDQYRKNLENQRKVSFSSSSVEGQQEKGLEATIYRTIELHDSLIDYLGKRGGNGSSDNESLKSYSTSDTDENNRQNATPVCGNKHPKDDAQVIEELKVLSGQLRDSVQCLLLQLDDRNKEIEKLKATIKVLENEKQKGLKNNPSLKVVTDSSGGTSPFVFSPCSELSPDIMNDTRSLPPLELPNFDYSNLIKSSSNNNNAN